jgi:2-dehydro-3-deoxygalactonokinase
MKDQLALVGFEWAGTRLRAWAFDSAGEILSTFGVRESPVAGHTDWPGRIRFHLAAWLGGAASVPIIGCADVSGALLKAAGTGLIAPAPLSQVAAHVGREGGMALVPWIRQSNPPDLTCGAETILFGLGEPNGAICIAGQHTHHVIVEHGRVMEFSTEITAELRDLLLMHGSLSLSEPGPQTFDMAVFRDWVERALDTEDTPPVFSVEAALRGGSLSAANKSAALAGLMIGADVAAHYDPGDEVLLVADGPLLEAYGFALDLLGADVEETSALEALQDGLFEIADLAGLLGED